MKTALIMGITGGFGGSVAQELVRQGWSIRALMRDPARLPARFSGTEVIQGDATNPDAVREAAQGVDLIVYGVNPPGYNWKGRVLPMLEYTVQVAEELGLTVLFPGNVYVFDPADGPDFDEQAPLRPLTSKGALRKAMERRLQQASERGAQVIVLRMGDFIGEFAPSAWLGALVKRSGNGFRLSCPGPARLGHTWAYLPDAARTAVELGDKKDLLPAWNVFHFRGYRMSLNELADTLHAVSGQAVRMKSFPWWALRLMAPFSTLFRGLLEMRYLWQQEINLQGNALEKLLDGEVPYTPLGKVLREAGYFAQLKSTPTASGAIGKRAEQG